MDENVVPTKGNKLPWHIRNREKHKENCKRWRDNNKARHKEYCDKWIDGNRERYNENHRRTQRVYHEKQRNKKKEQLKEQVQ
jgi:hypothetical protein